MEKLLPIVMLLIALSIASERLVEILKGFCSWLNQQRDDPKAEGRRKAVLQGIAVLAGILTAWLARPAIVGVVPGPWHSEWSILALGLLASGGSGFWNAILTYLLRVKDIKKLDVAEKQRALAELC